MIFLEVLESILLPICTDSSSVSSFYQLPSSLENILNTSIVWLNHLISSGTESFDTDVQKPLEFDKEAIERIRTLESNWISEESGNLLRFMELLLPGMNPKLPESWLYGVSKEERAELNVLCTLLNFPFPENDKILSEGFDFAQLFR